MPGSPSTTPQCLTSGSDAVGCRRVTAQQVAAQVAATADGQSLIAGQPGTRPGPWLSLCLIHSAGHPGRTRWP